MSQNLMLDFNGTTPQQALTGQQKDWYSMEPKTVASVVGAAEERPDVVETMIRLRLLAKQCILQGIVEDRFAQAAKIKQHSHSQELLLLGMQVDIWRMPTRKEEHGWRGPGLWVEAIPIHSLPKRLSPRPALQTRSLPALDFSCKLSHKTQQS